MEAEIYIHPYACICVYLSLRGREIESAWERERESERKSQRDIEMWSQRDRDREGER